MTFCHLVSLWSTKKIAFFRASSILPLVKPICRFLLSSLLLAIACGPLAAFLVYAHHHNHLWDGALLGAAAEWYRLVENRRRACVEWLLPDPRPRRERAAFLDRSVLHWRG